MHLVPPGIDTPVYFGGFGGWSAVVNYQLATLVHSYQEPRPTRTNHNCNNTHQEPMLAMRVDAINASAIHVNVADQIS